MMNLTDCDSTSPDLAVAQHVKVACMYPVMRATGALQKKNNPQLAGFFSSLVDSVKTTLVAPLQATNDLLTHGTNAAKADLAAGQSALKKEIVGVSSVVAPVVSIFGPAGMAIGAALKLGSAKIQSDQAKAASLNAAVGNDMQVANTYKGMAGSVPGRNIGTQTLQQVMGAFVRAGGYPPLKFDREPDSPASDKTIQWAAQAAQGGIARGAASAQDIYNNEFQALIGSDPNAMKWMRGPFVQPGNAQYQLFIDFIDAAAAAQNPNFPYSYGVQASDLVQPVAAPSSFPGSPTTDVATSASLATPPTMTNQTAMLPAPVATPVAAAAPPIGAQSLAQAGVPVATSDQVAQMLSTMQAQGASQAQMLSAALAALQTQGVNTQAPAIQQAAAQSVAQAQSPGLLSSIPTWAFLAAGAGVVYLLMRKKK
jgi:hypothetical protein